MKGFSIIPPDLEEKDPRPFAFLYPNMIRNDDQSFIAFIKKMQRFTFYKSLKCFEDFGHANGLILLPATVLHWRRRNNFGAERRVKVGKKTFYFVREDEITKLEKQKLLDHIDDIRRASI